MKQEEALIRRAQPGDNAAVCRIVFETLEAYGIEPDPNGHDHDVVLFGSHGEPTDEFVAEIAGAVAGSVMVAPRIAHKGEGWLSKFFVDPFYRGRGIGRALLMHAIAAARERGYRRVALDTRTFFKEAIHLYEATGWKRTDETPKNQTCEVIYALDL